MSNFVFMVDFYLFRLSSIFGGREGLDFCFFGYLFEPIGKSKRGKEKKDACIQFFHRNWLVSRSLGFVWLCLKLRLSTK